MIWAVLIGNTRAVAALMEGLKVLRREAVPTASLTAPRKCLAFAKTLKRLSDTEKVLVASVVPPVDPLIRKALASAFGQSPRYLAPNRLPGLKLRVKHPAQVGADRALNALAVRELIGAPAIVVDYGTGTTFDVVDKSGAYCGGAILPGIGTSLAALDRFTAKIPLVTFKPVKRAVGRDTDEAVRSGVYFGALGTTRELLGRIRKELGSKAPAVATGGWSVLFEGTGLFRAVLPDLTHQGMALAAELPGAPK